jgi:hypothetical protein
VARGRKPGSLHSADSGRMTQREDAPIGMTQKKMTLNPPRDSRQPKPQPLPDGTLTAGVDAVPSPAARERVIWYSGDTEGKGNNGVGGWHRFGRDDNPIGCGD